MREARAASGHAAEKLDEVASTVPPQRFNVS